MRWFLDTSVSTKTIPESFSSAVFMVSLDCRTEEHGEKKRLDFTWDGNDEMDSAMGRGWAAVDGDALEGHIYFHLGDDSGFKATRM